MSILLLLIPLSVMLLAVAIGAFAWAVRGGQFEELDTPALDILVDDDGPAPRPAEGAPDAG
ncbi:cbb3-type cytochrome oxidase assembly protein CcoS [Vulcaniibacterium gelatinicum]|uniref:cbb3-type cytochrome oxidase assembly protein CcoS n=1 Tax=Vulcaniibacterium gelatinicum TaxID=2598725 RepID=UPI0011CC3250|nr:cbb3-type cytochrome oxidase assembly protein CcoS [Vulcaniibacterium gelatinicum]